MKSESARSLVREAGQDPDTISLSAAEELLKARLVELHPDPNGQAAASPEYHRVKEALDAVRSEAKEQALVPADQTRDLIQLALQLAKETRSHKAQLPSRKETAAQVRASVRDAQSGLRVASGSVLAAASALFALLGQADHPIVVAIRSAPEGMHLLFAAWLLSGFLFLFLRWRESEAEREVSYFLSDRGLRRTIQQLMADSEDEPPGEQSYLNVSQMADAVMNLQRPQRRSAVPLFFFGREAALEVAAKQIEILEERGALEPIPKPSFERRYRFVPGSLDDVGPW